jgi:UDPglucose 6-dehydrogenase
MDYEMRDLVRVAVIGTGHVGLVVAACLADMGYHVTGVDRPATVKLLNQGEVGFFEPGLQEKVALHVRKGHLRFTDQLEDAVDSKVILIAIGTIQSEDGAIHITDIERTIVKLGQLCSNDTVIAIKSTLPVGSCRHIADQIPDGGPALVYNPEFFREGSAIQDFFQPNKIVLGSGSRGGIESLMTIYQSFPCSPVCTNWETAEIIKLAQNALNALHISFLNEVALTVEGLNSSLELIAELLREDLPSLQRYLNPGFSYGGACLPGNIAYMGYLARCQGYSAPLMRAVAEVNDLRIDSILRSISRSLGELKGRRIALWGLSYKEDTDDLRGSPSVTLVKMLQDAGALVFAFDPHVERNQVEQLGCIPSRSAVQTLDEADALVVLTRCPEFAEVPAAEITSAIAPKRIFDLVGALPQIRKVM